MQRMVGGLAGGDEGERERAPQQVKGSRQGCAP